MIADTDTPAPDDATHTDIVLAVDLDGTLCRSDTLYEAVLALITYKPLQLLFAFGHLRHGRAEFKAKIADLMVMSPDALPMNEAVLDHVRTAQAQGQVTALVSAADHRQVIAMAEATGLFDQAYGSAEGRNLKGAEKAAFLTERFGAKGFDYIGDSAADIPVWAAARHAITVGASCKLTKKAQTANDTVSALAPPQARAPSMLRAIRPHQWLKNLLLFLPMLTAHNLSAFGSVLLGFIAFSLAASAVYVINDLLDLTADRAHPRKSTRPFAAGALSIPTGIAMATGLLTLAILISLTVENIAFLAILLVYLTATFAYSFWLKRKLIVDVLMLAGLYTIRIVAGGAAASVVLSPWIAAFSMFIFLALAAVKRQAELTDLLESGRDLVGRAYAVDDLPILRGIAISAGQSTVVVLALYISLSDTQQLYTQPKLLWLICPLLLYWIMRMIMKTHHGAMTDDPIVFAVSDRISQALIITCLAIAAAAI